MGSAYADMDGPKWYMGANGGARYTGPFKPVAQREMEAALMMDRRSGGALLFFTRFRISRLVARPSS